MSIERDQLRTLLILAIVIAVFFGALWVPMRSRQGKLRRQIEQLQGQVQSDRTGVENLDELFSRTDELHQQVTQMQKHVPTDIQLAALLSDLNAMIEALDIVNSGIVQEEVIAAKDYRVIPIKLTLNGPFVSMFDMVRQIEAMNRLVRINNLDMRRPARSDEPDNPLQVTMQIDTFSAGSEVLP